MPEALNAVIYARYSSDRQTEQSIEGQLRECYAFAKANDIAVIDTYIDRAISGKTDNRPAFQKMIEDSAKRQFQAVIVYRLDRFTRNRYDSAIYKARLKKNGVKVLSAMENLNGSPESIIMESLLEGMAEYYSVELSQKITRGMRENALKGKALGGQRVLGYKVNSDCYFEIDETTAPVVVDIFKLYSSGKTVKEICDILNARGVKTARGGAFNKNSLHTILTNKKYIGIYKTKYGEIVGGIPAIIDKELFEMVALRMEQNKKAPARAKAEINYLLSTKLFCGKCRSAMVGESGTSKTGKKYYYYACVKKKREKACDKSNVKKDWIEDLVIQRTVTDILKDDVIEKIADRLVELQKAEAAESGTMLYLQNSLAEIQVSIKNIMTAIEKGIITESTKTRLTELEDEKRNVEIEIAKESIARRIISREQIIYWISSFKDGDITSEKYRQQLIDTFVHAVFVYDDKIVITYNYSGENNTATISDLDLSSPPKGYYTNLFTLSAALPSQYGSSNTDRKERIFSLVESVRSFFMSCGLSTDCPWTICGQSQNAAIFTYRSVRFSQFLIARSHLRKNPHKRDSECYNALAGVQKEEVFITDMTARFKAYRDLNREIDLQIERLEQMEAKAGSPSTPNLSGMPKGSSFQHDRIADTVARIADLRSEIDSLIAERDAEQKALEALIRRLPNADRRLVLRLRYLDSEDWEDVLFIAYGGKPDFNEKYGNYKQRVFRHHKQALTELEAISENE